MLRTRICAPSLLAAFVSLLVFDVSPAAAEGPHEPSLQGRDLSPAAISSIAPGTLDLFLSQDHVSVAGLPKGALIAALCNGIPPDNGEDEDCRLLASNGGGSGRIGPPFELTVENFVVLPTSDTATVGLSFSAFSMNHEDPFLSTCPTDISTWIELDSTVVQPVSNLTLLVDGVAEGAFFGTIEVDVVVGGQSLLLPQAQALTRGSAASLGPSATLAGTSGTGGSGGSGGLGQLTTRLTFDIGGRWLLEAPASPGKTNLVLFADRDIEGNVDPRPACAAGKKSCACLCVSPSPPAAAN